jgi:hypothetical protein
MSDESIHLLPASDFIHSTSIQHLTVSIMLVGHYLDPLTEVYVYHYVQHEQFIG